MYKGVSKLHYIKDGEKVYFVYKQNGFFFTQKSITSAVLQLLLHNTSVYLKWKSAGMISLQTYEAPQTMKMQTQSKIKTTYATP